MRSREAPEPREVRSRLPDEQRQHCIPRRGGRNGGAGSGGGGLGGDMDTPCKLRV